jgi:hypothetical protein
MAGAKKKGTHNVLNHRANLAKSAFSLQHAGVGTLSGLSVSVIDSLHKVFFDE